MNMSVADVAPGKLANVVPPSELTCHCTVGAGDPVAAALNDADCPEETVTLDGGEVTVSVEQEDIEAGVVVGVVPLVVFVMAKS